MGKMIKLEGVLLNEIRLTAQLSGAPRSLEEVWFNVTDRANQSDLFLL